MAGKGQRIGAGLLAGLFLLTSVGATVLIIMQIKQQDPEVSEVSNQDQTQDNLNSSQGQPLPGFTPRSTPVTELEKTDITVGTGAEATADSEVTVHYTGALVSDGLIFESSLDSGQPATFGLAAVIEGWQVGVPGMKVGGKRRLVIPYAMAYGEEGSLPTIPPKADLVFDIELLAAQ